MDINELKNIFKDCELSGEKILIKSDIARFIEFVKDNYGFNVLKEIIAIDNKDDGVELIYKLFSSDDEEEVLISTTVSNEAESVSHIFNSAVADEREIYDLFGIHFIGHEELKRLYMPESWNGHPLKKDYEQNDERLNWND